MKITIIEKRMVRKGLLFSFSLAIVDLCLFIL